jgi:hypothetical protein
MIPSGRMVGGVHKRSVQSPGHDPSSDPCTSGDDDRTPESAQRFARRPNDTEESTMSASSGRGSIARISPLRSAALTLCVLCALLGCRSVPREAANPTCPGDQVLAVRNETGEALDVYMSRPGGGKMVLGSVGPGRTEFVLPALQPGTKGGRGFQGRSSNGQWVFGRKARQLTFDVECAKGADAF